MSSQATAPSHRERTEVVLTIDPVPDDEHAPVWWNFKAELRRREEAGLPALTVRGLSHFLGMPLAPPWAFVHPDRRAFTGANGGSDRKEGLLEYRYFPFALATDHVKIAIISPFREDHENAVVDNRFHTGLPVWRYLASEAAILRAIRRFVR